VGTIRPSRPNDRRVRWLWLLEVVWQLGLVALALVLMASVAQGGACFFFSFFVVLSGGHAQRSRSPSASHLTVG
jgi:hypothetical protein